jgi:hypothetical protein
MGGFPWGCPAALPFSAGSCSRYMPVYIEVLASLPAFGGAPTPSLEPLCEPQKEVRARQGTPKQSAYWPSPIQEVLLSRSVCEPQLWLVLKYVQHVVPSGYARPDEQHAAIDAVQQSLVPA